jgi:DNA gyrase/topoisomerase IV subunit A
MATAEDIVEILAMVENLKDINNQLQRSTVNTGESLEVAKRYYGIHTVMLEVAAFMHEEFVHKVNSTYLKKLRTITQETRAVQAEAREMLRRERDPGLRKVLQNNVKSQDLTLRTAAIYRDRLIEQRDSIREALNRLHNRVDVARNTYRTAQLANDLINMLRSSDESFEAIMKLDLPDLRPFENLELQREFDRLTRELEGAPSS